MFTIQKSLDNKTVLPGRRDYIQTSKKVKSYVAKNKKIPLLLVKTSITKSFA
jgi:hypothetical protein